MRTYAGSDASWDRTRLTPTFSPYHGGADGRNNAKNARVHIATYQTLGIDKDDGEPSFLFRHYPEDYFSHIVIDECHRSAWGKWSVVLTRNPNAVQIGLTATPRQLKCTEASAEARADAQALRGLRCDARDEGRLGAVVDGGPEGAQGEGRVGCTAVQGPGSREGRRRPGAARVPEGPEEDQAA